jgi:SAM-dependent methyltransferase
MKIRPNDLVLEVGSGDRPYPRSDVLLDKLPKDSSEREARRKLVIDRPIVIAEVEALPFPNKSFDYIIASHVLEHSQNPARFLDELSRVGKRGYIETPLPLRERVFAWPFHRWYVYQEGKRLVLIKKTGKNKQFFAGMKADKRRELYYLEGKKLLNLKFEWQVKINSKIYQSEPKKFLVNLDKTLVGFLRKKETEPRYWQQKLKSRLLLIDGVAPASKWLKNSLFQVKFSLQRKLQARERGKDINLFSLIVCPVCKEKLQKQKMKLVCFSCGRKYDLFRGRIPNLIA